MKFPPNILLFFTLIVIAKPGLKAQDVEPNWQERFRVAVGEQVQRLEAADQDVLIEPEDWLFFRQELRFLSIGKFWGEQAAKVSHIAKPPADPLPAIVDFNEQLKKRGIRLILVPVPAKAAIYADKILPGIPVGTVDVAPSLHRFYDELRAKEVDVLDLTPLFNEQRSGAYGEIYCKSDTHWSGAGCALAAQAIGKELYATFSFTAAKQYNGDWQDVKIGGDLTGLRKGGDGLAREKIRVRPIYEKGTGAPVEPDPGSPVLLLGDSHTLVFHDFLASHAGLLDQLALEMGFASDLIGTRGSGSTPVRIDLYRHSLKDPQYLTRKKVIIWCFTAREFTEADTGWTILPVAK